jgi:hypothetical protein
MMRNAQISFEKIHGFDLQKAARNGWIPLPTAEWGISAILRIFELDHGPSLSAAS